MPVQVTYPGVYIQEVPSGVRAIAGVPTAIAAFVGYTSRGPTNTPIQLFSYADFERNFGRLHADSPLSYAVNHFFLNGGANAYVVRVAENAQVATVMLETAGGNDTLLVSASAEGDWGNHLILNVDYATATPGSTFNLTIIERVERNGQLVPARTEVHRNLSMNPDSANFAVTAVNADSDLVELTDQGAAGAAAVVTGGIITDAEVAALPGTQRWLAVAIDGAPPIEFDLFGEGEGGGAALTSAQDLVDVINDNTLAPGSPCRWWPGRMRVRAVWSRRPAAADGSPLFLSGRRRSIRQRRPCGSTPSPARGKPRAPKARAQPRPGRWERGWSISIRRPWRPAPRSTSRSTTRRARPSARRPRSTSPPSRHRLPKRAR